MKKLSFYIFLALGSLVITKNVFADGFGSRNESFLRGDDMHMGYMMDGGYFGFGWIPTVIFWALIILSTIMVVKHFSKDENKEVQNNKILNEVKSPLEILKERYAKGEINKEEFDKVKKDLE